MALRQMPPLFPLFTGFVFVIPGCASWRRPGIHTPCGGVLALNETPGLIPGSRLARPGMTGVQFPGVQG